jgi:hypothetical protein
MTTITATLWLLLAVSAAGAEPSQVPKSQGGVCPSGYASGTSYCVPVSDRAPRAIPKIGACPSGWADNGHFCTEVRPPR